MKLPAQQHIITLTSIILIVCLAIILLIIVPAIQEILSLENHINQTQALLEKQYQKTQRLRRSIHEIDAVLVRTEKFNLALIEPGDELNLITQLEQLADQHQIKQTLHVELLQPQPVEPNQPAPLRLPPILLGQSYYLFSFLNQGSFSHHLQYLRALEQLPYYFVIDIMQWEKRDQLSTNETPITVRFDAKLYLTKRHRL